jgi:hypothetical protein
MNRTFGFELEFINLDKNVFLKSLKTAGFPVYSSRYNNSKSSWRVIEDRSILNSNFTGELISPILQGQHGIDTVKAVVSLLKTNGAQVNTSCGLHVHVSVKDFKLIQLKNLVQHYSDLELELDKKMHSSRRFNINEYCLSNHKLLTNPEINAKFMRANTKTRLADSFGTRYLKLNLKSIQLFDTIEFRQHHSTVDPNEVVDWIQYCLNFVNKEKGI